MFISIKNPYFSEKIIEFFSFEVHNVDVGQKFYKVTTFWNLDTTPGTNVLEKAMVLKGLNVICLPKLSGFSDLAFILSSITKI